MRISMTEPNHDNLSGAGIRFAARDLDLRIRAWPLRKLGKAWRARRSMRWPWVTANGFLGGRNRMALKWPTLARVFSVGGKMTEAPLRILASILRSGRTRRAKCA